MHETDLVSDRVGNSSISVPAPKYWSPPGREVVVMKAWAA